MFVYSSEDLDFGGSMVSGLEVWDLGKAYYRGLESESKYSRGLNN